ncbi:hypothetical protein [Halorussus aquaticus]|uniref:Small CPxCG-related zinc finger protein n=1 Tax=Halorussus aquaticus TaxID=2953748 RepID=A0ABD5Q038_9EURY|nr:hypothetical protein [Halorussus aquaticus]
MADDTVLCPDCGWTGRKSDLDESAGVHSCPICDRDIEFVE